MKKIITASAEETNKLGKDFAKKNLGGKIICLEGDLGAGKTTFAQGLLAGLGARGPYTSPTFLIMKKYQNVYHLDAYRVDAESVLDLGWEEIITDENNIIIVEWPERIRKIIPTKAIWIKFKWIEKNKRSISFNN